MLLRSLITEAPETSPQELSAFKDVIASKIKQLPADDATAKTLKEIEELKKSKSKLEQNIQELKTNHSKELINLEQKLQKLNNLKNQLEIDISKKVLTYLIFKDKYNDFRLNSIKYSHELEIYNQKNITSIL